MGKGGLGREQFLSKVWGGEGGGGVLVALSDWVGLYHCFDVVQSAWWPNYGVKLPLFGLVSIGFALSSLSSP